MPTYPTCVFCNRNDSRPSKEELLAKWIAREFPDATWTVTRALDDQPPVVFTTRGHFGLTSRKPCTRCNNEWMSQLEEKVKPILAPMIHGEQTALSLAEQLILARWATKSAVVYDTHVEDDEYFFMDADCHTLFTSNAMPFVDSAIYLARYDGVPPEQIVLKETRRTGRPQSPYTDNDLFYLEAYAATFAIKHFALQVFTLRRHEELRKTGPVSLGIADFWRDRTICIWPLGDSVIWPPRIPLDMASFTRWVTRWRSPDIAL